MPREEAIMFGFVFGLLAGGVAGWMFRDRLKETLRDKTPEMRTKAADQLEKLQHKAEGAIDTAKDRLASRLRAGQDYLRADRGKGGTGPTDTSP
jgi:gas vesicle protein